MEYIVLVFAIIIISIIVLWAWVINEIKEIYIRMTEMTKLMRKIKEATWKEKSQ